ncbi:hypothetical protein BCR34DRAFT_465130, partial [Clohesyomyces aquaticus]
FGARLYHQHCKACGTLSRPQLDDSYAERVAYRIKRRCGVPVVAPLYSSPSRGPHKSHLCEGCK